MFSKQVKTIFRVLGNALLALAAMPAEGDEHEELTATQYINRLDAPDAGTEIDTVITNTAALVFGAAEPQSAAAVFAAVPAGLPTYTMTDKAQGFAREQFHETGWTDEALVADGVMVVTPAPVVQDPSPNAPPGVASGTVPAPSAPPTASTQAAPPAVQTNTAAQAPAGGVTRDSSGLPWDNRIHSGGRTTKADGTWQKKKGVSDVEVARVTAELRSSGPVQVATPFTPLNAAAPAPAPAAPPAAPAAPAAAPAPAAAGVTNAVPTTFAELCKWITANGFTMIQALEVAKPYGITAMGLLAQATNAAFIPLVHADLAKQRTA